MSKAKDARIYVRIADDLRNRILQGDLPAGAMGRGVRCPGITRLTHRRALCPIKLAKVSRKILHSGIRQHEQRPSAHAARLQPTSAYCTPQCLCKSDDAQPYARVRYSTHLRSEGACEFLTTGQTNRMQDGSVSAGRLHSINGGHAAGHHQRHS
ncbi:hypothetical protein GCM10009733_003490 [Nonomuraea maheshkhaliensis]|uniref:GntR family transcriptional regulator n=1 Tax=Nonomuraea maheshkhaliensis TaxID=419590 RepID=A0ABN2EMP1_9ACTN